MRSPRPADLPTLTSLRFFAALMIFAFHLREYVPSDALYALAPGLFHGVSFFFVLSGFVLTHVYSDREISKAQFYRARVARIAPLHVACLLGLVAALPPLWACGQLLGVGAAAGAFGLKFLMLDAWVPLRSVQSSWNNVSWSISVEMAFYAAFPWLSAIMSRRPFWTLGAAFAVSASVAPLGAAWGLPVFSTDGTQATLLQLGCDFPLARGFEFVLGMAACLLWRDRIAPLALSWAAWTAIETVALAVTASWLIVAVPALVSHAQGFVFIWLRASGSALTLAPFIVALAGGRGLIGRALSARALVKLGEVSFAFYLIHVIVMRTLVYHLGATGVIAPFALSLLLAFVLHEGVELPMRRRLLARPLARAPALTSNA